MKVFCKLLLLLIFIISGYSCSKEECETHNQTGEWEGVLIEHWYNDSITISIDTFPQEIRFNSDGTGQFNEFEIEKWEILNFNELNINYIIETGNERINKEDSHSLIIDQVNYQEWQRNTEITVPCCTKIRQRWILSKK